MKIPYTEAAASLTEWASRLGATAKLRLYAGVAPASAETSRAGNTLLAELDMNATPFGAPAEFPEFAEIAANAISPAAAVDASDATFADVVDSAGVVKGQLTVSNAAGTGEVKLAQTAISVGANVAIDSLKIRRNKASS